MAVGTGSALAATLILIFLYRLSKIGSRPKGLPPGPPTLPLIGNLHLMPKEKGHLQFQKWANEYGPIYSLILGTQVMIVLSSDRVVKDLLDARSAIYSSRPEMYLGQRVVSGGLRIVLMEYGELWRTLRGIIHNGLNVKASLAYVPYQDLESKAMLCGFLEQPSQFFKHLRRYTNSISTQMIFGFRTLDTDDPKLEQLFRGFEKWSELAGSQTAALLDVFPILRYLPDSLLPTKRYAKELHKKEYGLYVGHFLDTKKKFREGKATPCLCLDLIRAQDELELSDGIAGYLSGSLLEAGSDTSASTLIGFIQALLIFPEVATLAQTEIDRVCGDRIPDLSDLPNLPYTRGIIKESMRWMPTAILGIPHATTRDDEYLGYHIPSGSGVILNVWAIHNDPSRHSEPRRFDPSRWAHDSQTSAAAATNRDPAKRDHFGFGAGRRICQGMHIADRNLFLAISRLLWAFEFRRAVDPSTGEEIVPTPEDLTNGLLVCPNSFDADIKPRNEFKAEAIRAEWSKMTELLDDKLQWKAAPEGLVRRENVPGETKASI